MTNLSWSEGQQTRAEASRCQRRHFWQFSNVAPRLIQIGGLPRNLNRPGKISSWIVAPPPLIPTKKDPERVKENGDPERTIREIGRGYILLFHSSLSIASRPPDFLSVSPCPRNLVPMLHQFVPPWPSVQASRHIPQYRSYYTLGRGASSAQGAQTDSLSECPDRAELLNPNWRSRW